MTGNKTKWKSQIKPSASIFSAPLILAKQLNDNPVLDPTLGYNDLEIPLEDFEERDEEAPPEAFDQWVEGKSAAESSALSSESDNFVSETPKPILHSNYLQALSGGLDSEWLSNMLEESLEGRDSRNIKTGNEDFDKFVQDLRKMQSL